MAKCCVNVGELRHKVTLQQKATTVDAAGQVSDTWTDYRTCRAKVMDVNGREIQRGDQVEAIVGTVITIQYPRSGRFPKPQDRLKYNETADLSRTLNIHAVKRLDGVQRFVELHCMEVQ